MTNAPRVGRLTLSRRAALRNISKPELDNLAAVMNGSKKDIQDRGRYDAMALRDMLIVSLRLHAASPRSAKWSSENKMAGSARGK